MYGQTYSSEANCKVSTSTYKDKKLTKKYRKGRLYNSNKLIIIPWKIKVIINNNNNNNNNLMYTILRFTRMALLCLQYWRKSLMLVAVTELTAKRQWDVRLCVSHYCSLGLCRKHFPLLTAWRIVYNICSVEVLFVEILARDEIRCLLYLLQMRPYGIW
jgi:hypothetical protein